MRGLDFILHDWVGEGGEAPIERVTLASLSIEAGAERVPVTEVEDTIARTVRNHITVPAWPLLMWLLVHWWRLRWEPRPPAGAPAPSWLRAHSMAAIGGGFAWPPLEFSSDGAFLQMYMQSEPAPDVAAIRYLRTVVLDVSAKDFETAVDALAEAVQGRLATSTAEYALLRDIRNELREERGDPIASRQNRWQALAGIDTGDATAEWLGAVDRLSHQVGASAADEVMAITPYLDDGLVAAQRVVEQARNAAVRADLSTIAQTRVSPNGPGELPWQKGERFAGELRRQLSLPAGPVSNDDLGGLLGVAVPASTHTKDRRLAGALRLEAGSAKAAVLVPGNHPATQRFYFARLIGCALVAPESEALLPVTAAATALQKFERAFAQELLCPWRDLDEFTDEHGIDEDGVFEAARHFGVSEMLVLSTLVNKHKAPRERLAQ